MSYVLSLQPKGKAQEEAFWKMTDMLKDVMIYHKQTTVAISQPLTPLEWGTIIGLLPVILGSIYYINIGTPLSILTSSLPITVAMLLVYILRDINYLSWKEQTLIWESLADTFVNLDLLPYFPDTPLLAGRINLNLIPEGQKIRVALYPNKYPDVTKQVKILVNSRELRSRNPFRAKKVPWVEE